MSPIVADAAVRIAADLSKFKQDLGGIDKQTQTLGQRMKSTFSPGGLGFTAAAAGIGAFTAGIGQAVGDLINMERISAQTDAAIRSTGGAANVTRDEIVGLAEATEELTGIEMETVQEGANLLLTFKRIRNEVGEGNDVFDQATKAALDLSVAFGMDMRSASLMLGKALDDPIRGVTALRRAGVLLNTQQERQIRTFVESGDVLKAQQLILRELETQVGGSAEAFGNTTAGKMQKFTNAVGNFFEGVVTGAVDMVQDTGGLLNNFAMDAGDMGMRIHVVADRLGEDFTTVKDRVRNEMAETGKSFDDVMTAMEADAYEKASGITDAMSEGTRFAAEAIAGGGPVVAKEAGKVAGMFPWEIRQRDAEIRAAGRENVIQFALGVLDAQTSPKTAFEVLTRLQDEELTRAEQISYLHGLAASAELAAGQKDGRPGVSLAAAQLVKEIDKRLSALGAEGYDWGFNIGAALARGLDFSKPIVRTSAGGLAEAVRGQIGIRSEPKALDSPLRGITKWGGNIVHTIADDILANLGSLDQASNAMAGRLSPSFNPGHASVGIPPASLASGAVGGGVTVQIDARSVIPRSAVELREIGERVGPALDDYFTRGGRFPRRPRN